MKTTWIAVAGVVSLVAGGAGLTAWQASERVDAAMNAKIRDEGLNRSQVETTFGMLVDQIGPRLTASPAHKRAADYVREMATKYGLSDARLEAFEFGRGWVLDGQTIEMIEPRYMPLLGYAGYLPFGLECLLVVERLIGGPTRVPRTARRESLAHDRGSGS